MLPIMLGHRVKDRKQMIHDALEAKAPKMYQELKKSLKLQSFLTTQEQMMMEAFREEKRKWMLPPESNPKPGENPIEQVQRIEMNLLTAWNQTKETYLDFSDQEEYEQPPEKIKITAKFQGTGKHEGVSLKEMFKMYPNGKIVGGKK